MRGERVDALDKIIRRFLWTFFVLPKVDREEPALSQRRPVFFGSRGEGGEACTDA